MHTPGCTEVGGGSGGQEARGGCDFARFLKPEPEFISALTELQALGFKLCIFTNGPRKYGLKVLEQLELRRFFKDEHVFAVEDVLPTCKPEPEVRDTPATRATRCSCPRYF